MNTTKSSTGTWSRKEAERRARDASALVRQRLGLWTGVKVEIGRRLEPTWIVERPEFREDLDGLLGDADGDDLAEFVKLDQAPALKGSIVHLYVSERTYPTGWELVDVVIVWLGNDECEPEIIDPAFANWPTRSDDDAIDRALIDDLETTARRLVGETFVWDGRKVSIWEARVADDLEADGLIVRFGVGLGWVECEYGYEMGLWEILDESLTADEIAHVGWDWVVADAVDRLVA